MNLVPRVALPPVKPLLIFDGDCGFCRSGIARWKQMTGERVDYAPLQSDDIAARFPELTREQLESAVHLIQPDGRVTRAAEAVFQLLAVQRRWPLWMYEKMPGIKPLTEFVYRRVAANRGLASKLTRLFWGDRPI